MASRSTLIEARQITSPRVGALHRYWQSKRRDGLLPTRAAIDPIEIPRLLPYLVIAEIEPSPMRIRYRLVGTQVVEDNGSDFTNRYIEECSFAVEPLLLECYRRLVETQAPVFAYYEWHKRDLQGAKGAVGANETGFFPLSSDGVNVDLAISLADPNVPPYPPDKL
ncbi:MAG TPA: PAS domain-containing protein [Dongiaceae bacterium]|nr:PAS domain-containing protein [Dongiaceae bacterium]